MKIERLHDGHVSGRELLNANIQQPVRTPSKMVLMKFYSAPALGRDYYFTEDMQLDAPGVIITSIKFWFYGGAFANVYLGNTWQTDQDVFNVVGFNEMKSALITLKNKQDEVLLDSQPCASLFANFGSVQNLRNNKFQRRYYFEDVSQKASSIRFTALPPTPAPFIVPFEFFYK